MNTIRGECYRPSAVAGTRSGRSEAHRDGEKAQMMRKSLSAAIVAAIGFAFSADAADSPGGGDVSADPPAISDKGGHFNLVDQVGNTYSLSTMQTGKKPKQGTISGTSFACHGTGSYSVDGTYVGQTVHFNNHL